MRTLQHQRLLLRTGHRIKRLRKINRLTQAELAKVCEYKSGQIISQIENGLRDLKAWEIFVFANALHTSWTYLLTDDESDI